SSVFAMPEVFIGSFPDIGATHFYGRLPGRIGLYLALTGIRVPAADAVHLGLARHFVPQDRFESLIEALGRDPGDPLAILRRFEARSGESKLLAWRPAIDRVFVWARWRRFSRRSARSLRIGRRRRWPRWSGPRRSASSSRSRCCAVAPESRS